MKNQVLLQAAAYLQTHRRKKAWYRVVTCLAAVVVFCTTYALILPAITMEKESVCGVEAHTHDDNCYLAPETVLDCVLQIHSHTGNCYNANGVLVCEDADFVIHSHADSCYDSEGSLVCALREVVSHVHVDACYTVGAESSEETHTHTADSCYETLSTIVCGMEESEGHVHADECYSTVVAEVCGKAVHSHSDICYTDVTSYVCGQEQSEGHQHSDACYETEYSCICGTAEHTHSDSCYNSSENNICGSGEHTHGDSCYEDVTTRVCGMEEANGHQHTESCAETEVVRTCQQEVHAHDDICYGEKQVLECGREEIDAHTHSDSCYETVDKLICEKAETKSILICTEQEICVHQHSTSCYDENGCLICGLLNTSAHAHTEECLTPVDPEAEPILICTLEEHIHDEVLCYIDETADLETEDDWKKTLPETLDGDTYAEDLIAVAESQLGYTESARNVQIDPDGRIWGYSRYGAWYGEPYGEWNTMFVSFCLHYTGIEEVIPESSAYRMAQDLKEASLFLEEHIPQPGDLMFLTDDEDDNADRVGIIISVTDSEIKTIEGDTENNCVEYQTYEPGDEDILGYYVLPEKESFEEIPEVTYYCGQNEHTHDEYCYDADGNLTCELPEHSHADECLSEPVYYCGKEIHVHEESCQDENGELICGKEEHTHTEECEIAPVTYHCGLKDHSHTVGCYDAEGNVICVLEEHTHTEECLIAPVTHYCGREEHTHTEDCFDADGNVICGREEHTHRISCTADLRELSEEDRAAVRRVILLIDEMPSADEIDAKIAEFEAAEDYEGEEAWLTEVYQQVSDVYSHYHNLEDSLKSYVINADKLLELDYIWSLQSYALITDGPTIYQINSYLDSSSEKSVMVFGGTVAQKVTYQFLYWYAVVVEEDSSGNLKVTQILQPGTDKSNCEATTENGFVLLFYQTDTIPDAEVGDYVTVHFTVPQSGVYKASGYGTVSFSSTSGNINSAAPTVDDYTSTSDFIELNLYDYNYSINNWWRADSDYPGFQWNGGAYSKTDNRESNSTADKGVLDNTTDRNSIDSIDFGNSMITNFSYGNTADYAKSVGATNVTSQGGLINALDVNKTYGVTNRPIGLSTGSEVISRTLVNGYPALADGTSLSFLFGDETADTYNAVTKLNTSSIDGLFLQDETTGEYQYNSRENHAQYSNNFFTRYNQIITPNFITYPFGNFLPLNSISDLTQATQVGAFNYPGGMEAYVDGIKSDLRTDNDALGASDWKYTTRKQLLTMLEEYEENWNTYTYNGTWPEISPANAIRDYFQMDGDNPSEDVGFVTQQHLDNMYNIDWNVDTNFFFGMDMKMTLMQPKNGYTGNDTNKDGSSDYPMVFYFTGDDDVWVYIDDVLFLDLSGIHRHVGGKIDFVNGKVFYYYLDTANTGDVSETHYAWYSFAALFRAAGWTEEQIDTVLKADDGSGNRPFKDYSVHDFNFYYMERGSGSSVCRMNFNFPMLKKNSISVTKENVTVNEDGSTSDTVVVGNPDYYFNIVTPSNTLFVGPNSVTGITNYKVMDSAGNILKNTDGTDQIFTTDQYGIFTLKAGQTAVFEGIEENEGKYFVQELIKAGDNAQYPDVYINDTITRYNDLIDWSYRNYFSDSDSDNETGPYGYKWYGRSGYETDASTNSSFYFEQQNHVDVSKLGSLSLTKQVESYTATLAETYYKMYVLLDDQPLPEGITVTVTAADGSIREATVGSDENGSYIEIVQGETATIPNIISGTKFKIWESDQSSSGYQVSYKADNAEEVVNDGSSISGVVRVDADVIVTITNAENGTQIEIPGIKSFSQFAGGPYSYDFVLTETDATGTAVEGGITLTETVKVTADNTEFTFDPITYLKHSYDNLPATHYYLIEETGETDDGLDNTQKFLVEVTVTENESDEGISAEVTKVSEYDGSAWAEVTDKQVNFVNTLTGDLTLSKTVNGVDTGQEFGFKITFDVGNSGVDPLPTSYPITIHFSDGNTTTSVINFNGNDTILTLGHNESVTIQSIPIGVTWTIIEGTVTHDENNNMVFSETPPAGYITSTTVGTVTAEGTSSTGSIVTGETDVVYTNTSTYTLPETGGTGTILYTMAGLMLMLFSAAYLLYKTKKRRREVY